MKKGVGHYIKTGLGGASTAARRFGGTVSSAGALYAALSPGGQGPGTGFAAEAAIGGKSSTEVRDALVEAIRPVDGTLDAESARAAINDALSDLLEMNENAELSNLTEDQRLFVVERFVASDVCRRLELDVGGTIQSKAPTVQDAVLRLGEIRDYVQETVAAAFRVINARNQRITNRNITSVVRDALQSALRVFEDYLQ